MAPPLPPTPKPDLDADKKQRIAWRESFATFAADLMHVEHRDIPGKLVRLVPNHAQQNFIDSIQRMVALNLKMQVDVARAGQESYIPNLLKRVDEGRKILDHEIGVRLLYTKSRHAGVTSICIALSEQRLQFVSHYPTLLMAHDQDSSEEIFRKRQVMFDNWPAEKIHLRSTPEYDSMDRVQFAHGSRCSVRTAGVRGKRQKTRGWHFKLYHFSEYAHYETYSDVKACMAIAPASAWVIKESTANGRSGPFWQEWQQALTIEEAERAYAERDFKTLERWGVPHHQYRIFFPWLDDPGLAAPVFEWEQGQYNDLDEYERTLKAQFPDKFTPQKIKWRRSKIATDCQGQDLEPQAYFAQEFPATPEEAFQSSGSTVFSQEVLDLLDLKTKDNPPILQARLTGMTAPERPRLGGANFYVYAEPRKDRSYVMGVDAAQGIHGDYHYMAIFDQHDGTFFEEVASFWSNEIDAKAFGHVCTLGAELFNNAFITPEIQGGGLATCMTIVVENRYMRIYQRKTLDTISNATGDANIFRYGIFTSHQVKDALIQNARNLLSEKRLLLRTPYLIDQFKAFKKEDGKYSAPEGGHDDGVMAAVLGVFGARWAPSPQYVQELAKKSVAASDNMDARTKALIRAVAKKVERSMKKAKREPGFRPGLKKQATRA